MNKKLILALATGVMSSGAFAAACTHTAASAGTNTNNAVIGAQSTGTANVEMCVCNGGASAKVLVLGGSGTPITSAPLFIKNGFDMQCGSSTIVAFKEHSATLIGVAAGSAKGNQTVRGNSNGGSIGVSAKCTDTNTTCSGANVSTAVGLSSS